VDFRTAKEVFEEIETSSLAQLRRELFQSAVRYAHLRAEWYLSSQERRREMSPARTAAHDALIASCNALSRNMSGLNEPVGWRESLGDDRREIGDFACYLHCFFGVASR